MMLPLQEILNKYGIELKNVCHVGSHWGQEYEEYKRCGADEIYFIEASHETYIILKEKFTKHSDVMCLNYAVGDKNGIVVELNVERDNQGQSSSLLFPKLHLEQHPNVRFLGETESVYMYTLDKIMSAGHSPMKRHPNEFNMLMVDVQGFEYQVFVGAKEFLKNVDLIISEVNRGETYENNVQIDELDVFLLQQDFERVETFWPAPNLTWGDAAYVKRKFIK